MKIIYEKQLGEVKLSEYKKNDKAEKYAWKFFVEASTQFLKHFSVGFIESVEVSPHVAITPKKSN